MTSAIILAAGKGQRMGTELPKQFLSMGDDMLLTKTIRVFEESSVIQDIVLVTSEDWIGFCRTEIVDVKSWPAGRNGMILYIRGFWPARMLTMFLYMTGQDRS